MSYFSRPFLYLRSPVNSFNSTAAILFSVVPVLVVLCIRYQSQIGDAVIRAKSIDVIYLQVVRNSAMHICPDKSVRVP